MRKGLAGFAVFLLVPVIAAPTLAQSRDADTVFDTFCFSCHGTGWDNAPVIGDSLVWDDRRAKGIDVLLKHTIEGFNAMPPKGGCADCSEKELRAVVEMLIAP